MFQTINPNWDLAKRGKVLPLILEGRGILGAGAIQTSGGTVLFRFAFPQANNGYILKLGVDCLSGGFDYGGNVGFELRLGGTTPFTYGTTPGMWTGPRGSTQNPIDTYWQFTGPQPIQFVVRRLAALAAPLTFRVFASGLVIPTVEEAGKDCPSDLSRINRSNRK